MNPKSTSNQSSTPCTVLQHPSTKLSHTHISLSHNTRTHTHKHAYTMTHTAYHFFTFTSYDRYAFVYKYAYTYSLSHTRTRVQTRKQLTFFPFSSSSNSFPSLLQLLPNAVQAFAPHHELVCHTFYNLAHTNSYLYSRTYHTYRTYSVFSHIPIPTYIFSRNITNSRTYRTYPFVMWCGARIYVRNHFLSKFCVFYSRILCIPQCFVYSTAILCILHQSFGIYCRIYCWNLLLKSNVGIYINFVYSTAILCILHQFCVFYSNFVYSTSKFCVFYSRFHIRFLCIL